MLAILRTTETPFSPEDVDFLSRASGQIGMDDRDQLLGRIDLATILGQH